MNFLKLLLFTLAAQVVSARFCVYIDQWHQKGLPGREGTERIDCVIVAFANSTYFTTSPAKEFKPFISISEVRSRFAEGTKVMVALGGWGDTKGFSEGAASEQSRELYATNVAAMVEKVGADGIDIDWEYPGGNAADYKQIPNSEKVSEIKTYPLFVKAIRSKLGKDKLLSVAVPGLQRDMIAFTNETVMSYDLENRRDNITKHHSSVVGSLKTVDTYLSLGLNASKINLGFPFYAKYFSTKPGVDCSKNPLGCPLAPLEKADGSDNGKSGAFTFEKSNIAIKADRMLAVSRNGACGVESGFQCGGGNCCSQYGFCGDTEEFCGLTCVPGYGRCNGPTATESWKRASKNAMIDEKEGAQYYWDAEASLFWSWDGPEQVTRKFKDIVQARKLGGVMAWSLAEDSYDWSHLKAMQEGMK